MKNSIMLRLESLLEQLSEQAKQIDIHNAKNKAHRFLENNNLFSSGLFVTQSDCFNPYAKEISKRIIEFSRLKKAHKIELSKRLLEKIELQISALMNAMQANNTMHQAAKIAIDARKSRYFKVQEKNKYKNIAQKIMLSSHQLYQKLNEHHEFERRLMVMVTEKEQQLAHCKASQSQTLSNEVLALYQRLGRCRKAISAIERDIESAAKR